MTNRRKTKTERELVADIRKAHMIFCKTQERCKTCPLMNEDKQYGCVVAYVKRLLQTEPK